MSDDQEREVIARERREEVDAQGRRWGGVEATLRVSKKNFIVEDRGWKKAKMKVTRSIVGRSDQPILRIDMSINDDEKPVAPVYCNFGHVHTPPPVKVTREYGFFSLDWEVAESFAKWILDGDWRTVMKKPRAEVKIMEKVVVFLQEIERRDAFMKPNAAKLRYEVQNYLRDVPLPREPEVNEILSRSSPTATLGEIEAEEKAVKQSENPPPMLPKGHQF